MTDPTTRLKRATARIGGASGFWGDSSVGAPQLVALGDVDYIVFDYLAELTMSIMAAQRLKNPEAGFALDFVTVTCRQILKDCQAQGIRLISNAGGVNPQSCAKAVQALAQELGLDLQVAVVLGDDVSPQLPALREAGVQEFNGTRPLPEKLLTANAYLGALPIKVALDAGADVVITGRCVDSAVTVGALMHHFGWGENELDKLAQASLAGHIIECGAQGSGGLFTDWQDVPDWAHIGYPVVEVSADASFVATKPPHTGGLVNCAVIAEQLLYEIHDPANYQLPDVVCDFTQVRLVPAGEHRVRVSGALGKPPSTTYKVSATHLDGFKSVVQIAIVGFDAAAKARRTGEALLERTRGLFKQLGLPDYSATAVEILGTENAYGPHAQVGAVREAILRLAVRHPVKAALEVFAREIAAPGTSFAPGTTGMDGGRPSVNPCIKQFAFLIDKARVAVHMHLGGGQLPIAIPNGHSQVLTATPRSHWPAMGSGNWVDMPLLAIAHARSGDKGDTSNIGVIARHPDLLPVIANQITTESVAAHLAHFVKGEVLRFELPGIHAFNFVCHQALDGGGMASLRHDPLGKGMAQIVLGMRVRVPQELVQLARSTDRTMG